MTFITDLMKHPLATARLNNQFRITPSPDADEIEIKHPAVQNTMPVARSLKKALIWMMEQGRRVPLQSLRKQMETENDCHFGLLQTMRLVSQNLIVAGIQCPRGRLLAEIEYSEAGGPMPDMSAPENLTEDRTITLSRFCYLHREDDRFLLSMPLKHKRFSLREEAANLLFKLALGTDLRALRLSCGDDEDLFQGFRCLVNILYHDEFIIEAKDTSRLPNRLEDGDSAMQQWDFHDLVLHSNSRTGYNFGFDFGGAFPFINLIEPQPAVKPLPEGERIALYKPDLKTLADEDPSLTNLVIQRISVRAYDEQSPISLKQIGEFFFRTGRVLYESRATVTGLRNPDRQTDMEHAWRPYPTGGASYELEFYLTVDRADGLDPGTYYYSPGTHELIQLSEQNAWTEGLIQSAYFSCAQIVRPQTVIHIAARFQRVAWKYHNIAYSTMLRNTGVVYQTFYLTATAMRLAGCGLGSGSSALFSLATGNEAHVESSIGEFMLGSLPGNFSNIDLVASAAIHGATLSPTA